MRDIPADYYELGFCGAVEKHTGLDQEVFYNEFNILMRSIDSEKLLRITLQKGGKFPKEE